MLGASPLIFRLYGHRDLSIPLFKKKKNPHEVVSPRLILFLSRSIPVFSVLLLYPGPSPQGRRRGPRLAQPVALSQAEQKGAHALELAVEVQERAPRPPRPLCLEVRSG